ncbi:MAG TPA: methyltransferase [Vicinamibacterales bacterium]|nr:methyltransferase [Vicinamibacterales bacterium]
MTFSHSSKGRLTNRDLERFPGDSLFDRLARSVCHAGCLPRKELYEAWEMARRIRRVFRGGRIVDLAAGHGLLAHVLLILDNSSPQALLVDTTLPKSGRAVHDALVDAWPRLDGRFLFEERSLESVPLSDTDLVVSAHACGTLADTVLDRAAAARARVAVLPCCHDLAINHGGSLSGWIDGALAIDVMRAVRLEERGYHVRTQTIPAEITPKNRLLLGEPSPGSATKEGAKDGTKDEATRKENACRSHGGVKANGTAKPAKR